jgi:peptidoglycan-associated lipoprotein
MTLCKKRCFSLAASLFLVAGSLLSGCSTTGSGSDVDGANANGLSESDLNAQREARFGNGSIPTAEGEGMFRDVHFGYDSYAVEDEARQDLEYNARVLKQHPELTVTLEGHCDERGTVEYNMALGAERARAVKSALASMGVPSSKINTISYGEEVPLDPGHDEGAWAKNRRVHFSASGSGATAGGRGRAGAGSQY